MSVLLFGGTASLAGPICGVTVVMLLNELLRSAERYQMFIYGILLLVVIVLIPGGIYGTVEKAIKNVFRRKKEAAKDAAG